MFGGRPDPSCNHFMPWVPWPNAVGPGGDPPPPSAAAPSAVITEFVPIPEANIGAVVGPGGAGLRRIGQEAGVKVVLPRPSPDAPSAGDRSMELTGTPENITHARRLIQVMIIQGQGQSSKRKLDDREQHLAGASPFVAGSMLASAPHAMPMHPFGVYNGMLPTLALSPSASAEKPSAIRVVIDAALVGALVEKSGSGLKKLRELSGASLDLGREPFAVSHIRPHRSSPPGRLLSIRPPMPAAQHCLALVCDKLAQAAIFNLTTAAANGGVAPPAEQAVVAITVLLPSNLVGRVVGKGGSGLKVMREKFGVLDVSVDRDGVGDARLLALRGAADAVCAAACDALRPPEEGGAAIGAVQSAGATECSVTM